MSLKPYIGSGAYRGMDSAQAIAQYNRDLAQYEQAEAMQKLAKINEERLHQEEERLNELKRNEIQQMLSNDDSPYTGPTLVAINFYDEGTPEYEKYESIKMDWGISCFNIRNVCMLFVFHVSWLFELWVWNNY